MTDNNDRTYGFDEAARDAKELHKLQRKAEKFVSAINEDIDELQRELHLLIDRKTEVLAPYQTEMDRLEANLIAYHREQLESGGDKVIDLPHARLKSRKQPQGYTKDDDRLLEWVQGNAADYVKIAEPTVAWGDLKKQLLVVADKVIFKETGEVVEGVEPKPIEISFGVEVL